MNLFKIFGLLILSCTLALGQTKAPTVNYSNGQFVNPPLQKIIAGNQLLTTSNFGTSGTTSISSAGNTNLSAIGPVNTNTVTLGVGSGVYAATISLLDSGAIAGAIYELNVTIPASSNPSLSIYDNSTGGTLLSGPILGNGTAGSTTLAFQFNGTNWIKYGKGAALLYQNLADLPSASIARTNLGISATTSSAITYPTNTSNGFNSNDAFGNQYLPNAYAYVSNTAFNVICVGDSLTDGYNVGADADYTANLANLPFFQSSLVYGFGVVGSPTSDTQYTTTTSAHYNVNDPTMPWNRTKVVTPGIVPDSLSFGVTGTKQSLGINMFGTNDASSGIAFTANVTSGNAVIPCAATTGMTAGDHFFLTNVATHTYLGEFIIQSVSTNVSITATVAPTFTVTSCGVGVSPAATYSGFQTTYTSLVNHMAAHNLAVFCGTLIPPPYDDATRFLFYGNTLRINAWIKATFGGAAFGGATVTGVTVVDIASIPQAQTSNPDYRNFFFKSAGSISVHWSIAGHALVAQALSNAIIQTLPSYCTDSLQSFTNGLFPAGWLNRTIFMSGRSNISNRPYACDFQGTCTFTGGSGNFYNLNQLTAGTGNFNNDAQPGSQIKIGTSTTSGIVLESPNQTTSWVAGSFNSAAAGSNYVVTQPYFSAFPSGSGIDGSGALMGMQVFQSTGDTNGHALLLGQPGANRYYIEAGFDSSKDLNWWNGDGNIFMVFNPNALTNDLTFTTTGLNAGGTLTVSGTTTLNGAITYADSSSSSNKIWLSAMQASIPGNGFFEMDFGQSHTTNNFGFLDFVYAGGSGSSANYVTIGLGSNSGLIISGSGNVFPQGDVAASGGKGFISATTSSAVSSTLNQGLNLFTGSTASQTKTLPAIASSSGKVVILKNQASVAVTVASNSGSQIMAAGATSTSANIVVASGVDTTFWSDGTQWNQLSGNAGVPPFSQTASVTVSNTGTETTLTGAGLGSLTIPANTLVAGTTYRLKASGYLADLLTPTLDVKFKLGSVAIDDSAATALVTLTGNQNWTYDGTFTCRTTGASGTVFSQGVFTYFNGTTPLTLASPNTATSTIDTTASQAVTFTATWGTASSSNSIICTNLSLERIY